MHSITIQDTAAEKILSIPDTGSCQTWRRQLVGALTCMRILVAGRLAQTSIKHTRPRLTQMILAHNRMSQMTSPQETAYIARTKCYVDMDPKHGTVGELVITLPGMGPVSWGSYNDPPRTALISARTGHCPLPPTRGTTTNEAHQTDAQDGHGPLREFWGQTRSPICTIP